MPNEMKQLMLGTPAHQRRRTSDMPRYIDEEHLMEKVSRMIDYCEKNKDKKFNALDILFQVGDAIMDCPTADVVPREEVDRLRNTLNSYALQYGTVKDQHAVIDCIKAETAREIFAEIEKWFPAIDYPIISELKKKYTEVESNG